MQQIKDRLSIVDVVSQYVKLERAGMNYRARCPFHAERTPSFFVSPDRGTYHCFGCNQGGDIFSFLQEIEGLDFKGALKVLAEKAGVPLVYSKSEKKDDTDRLFELLEVATIYYSSHLTDEVKKYLKERGLSEGTIQTFRLGFAGNEWGALSEYVRAKKFSEREILEAGLAKKSERGTLTDKFRNRIIFPIADPAGRIVGFSGRIFGDNASPEAPKYLNSPETPLFHKSRILYGFDRAKQAIRKHNCAVLVEGQMDFLASHQAGWANTVAVSGTAFTPEHAVLIHRMTENLVIALDADPAGIKAAGRAARVALVSGLNVKVARLPSEQDPSDLVVKEGAEAWSKVIREAKDIITFLLDVLEEHTKIPDKFRRVVETIVLPFLADVRSPIAHEQYVREIAHRLGVSERAVAEAAARVPSTPDEASSRASAGSAKHTPTEGMGRAKNAYAILLWQQSLPKHTFDIKVYERELREAVGADAFTALSMLSTTEKEPLRFHAEEQYGKSANVKRETQSLIKVLLKERLSGELAEATAALKKAETEEDEKEIARLMGVSKLLTTKIAEL